MNTAEELEQWWTQSGYADASKINLSTLSVASWGVIVSNAWQGSKDLAELKIQNQVEARIEKLRADNHETGVRLVTASGAQRDLLSNEIFARSNQIIALQWTLDLLKQNQPCEHQWEDAGNQFVDMGDMCIKCGATR